LAAGFVSDTFTVDASPKGRFGAKNVAVGFSLTIVSEILKMNPTFGCPRSMTFGTVAAFNLQNLGFRRLSSGEGKK
jgi:hypothetical protein